MQQANLGRIIPPLHAHVSQANTTRQASEKLQRKATVSDLQWQRKMVENE